MPKKLPQLQTAEEMLTARGHRTKNMEVSFLVQDEITDRLTRFVTKSRGRGDVNIIQIRDAVIDSLESELKKESDTTAMREAIEVIIDRVVRNTIKKLLKNPLDDISIVNLRDANTRAMGFVTIKMSTPEELEGLNINLKEIVEQVVNIIMEKRSEVSAV